MPFSVRGQPLTKVNKLVTDFKVARENSKLRGYLSPFETNVWSHISPRFEGCCLRLAELCKNKPSDREMNEIEMIVADLQDLCSVGINLERFTLLMDEMQKAIYVYNLVESSTLGVLYIYESRGLERFQARADLFKEILH